ncbi:MAG: acyl transferase [Flavobacteriales bacterium]|nr:acyl transferase [Flavobacteriales bacterium]MDW8410667.1 acyl transferase [Flavobacteriales bacterium]
MDLARRIHEHQRAFVAPYREWVEFFGAKEYVGWQGISFLPIAFFKTREVYDFQSPAEAIFESSGTSGIQPSRHFVFSLKWYHEVASAIFHQAVGPPQEFHFLFLLPGYLERPHSSLVSMARALHQLSGQPHNPFFIHDFQGLKKVLHHFLGHNKRVILWGVTHALLDFAKVWDGEAQGLIVIETGGMKGRGPEISREALWEILQEAFPGAQVKSEYGMTELLSQAYTDESGLFRPPPWMRVFVQDSDDPLSALQESGQGVLHIADLANVHSCAFIATEDLGEVRPDGRFRVTGRLSAADLRGCQLMYL